MKKALLLVGIIILTVMLVACTEEEDNQNQEEDEERVVSVETAEVEEDDLTIERTISGRIEPNRTTPIMVEQPGEIDTLEIESGSYVDEDDQIATVSTASGTQTISAPASGELMQLQAEEGEMVNPEEPFAVIADTSSWKIGFSVSANIIGLMEEEETFTATINGEEVDATITQIETMPDDTGLYPVVATFEDIEDSDILTGAVATLSIPEIAVADTLIVPSASIVEENNESHVYVVNEENQVERKSITVNEMQSDEAAIEGELEAEDEIVITGQLTLQDGDSVEVVEGE